MGIFPSDHPTGKNLAPQRMELVNIQSYLFFDEEDCYVGIPNASILIDISERLEEAK